MEIFLSIVLFFLFSAPVRADVTYTVSPLVIDEKLKPRDIITRTITLTNTGSQPITAFPTVNNISVTDGGKIQEFFPPVLSDRTASLASWIEIRRLGINIKPGESYDFEVILRITPQPKPGTYHAFIGFGYGRIRADAEAQVESGQAPGTVISVTIADKKNILLKLSGFIVDRFVTKVDNQAAVYTFKNPGEEALTPTGEIILYDSKGKEVSALSVNDEKIQIPPGGEHVFTASVPVDGLFGKYKAFLSVTYGDSQQGSVQDTSFFYVFPLTKILIVLGVVLLCTIFGAWYFHKRYFDDDTDDSGDRLSFHVRDTVSEAKEHDVILVKK